MGDLKKAFDKEGMLEMLNRMKAASQEYSQANILKSTKTETYKCQDCKDEEWVMVTVPQNFFTGGEDNGLTMEVCRACKCRESKRIERAFKTSKITAEFQLKNFDTFNLANRPASIRNAYQTAKIYADNFERFRETKNNSMCMLGNVGSGKTHLLMAVVNELMSKGVNVQYFPWVEGFNEIKDDLSLTEEKINRMQKVDLLFIDDMWKGRTKGGPTDFQIEQAFAVINYRYMEKLPVLISSEKDIDQMCAIDEALGSRINEMCKDFRVILKGGREMNYRLREDESA